MCPTCSVAFLLNGKRGRNAEPTVGIARLGQQGGRGGGELRVTKRVPGDLSGSGREVRALPVPRRAGLRNLSPPDGASAFRVCGPSSPARAAEFEAGWNLGMVRKELTDSRCARVWSAATASTEHRLHLLPQRLSAVAAEGTSCSHPRGTGARPGTAGYRPDRLIIRCLKIR